jgi:hypothetical protein
VLSRGYNYWDAKRVISHFRPHPLGLSQWFPIVRSPTYHDVTVTPNMYLAKYRSLHNSRVVCPESQLSCAGITLIPGLRDGFVTDNSGSSAVTRLNDSGGLHHGVSSQMIVSLHSQGHWAVSTTSSFRVAYCGSWPSIIHTPYLKCIGHAPNCTWEEPFVHVATAVATPFAPISVIPCELQS